MNVFKSPESVILNPTTSRISLLLHESEVELRTSVNNKDILQVWWGLTGFSPSTLIYHVFIKTMCWNACKYVWSKQL